MLEFVDTYEYEDGGKGVSQAEWHRRMTAVWDCRLEASDGNVHY